jgi:hypothetical protein
MNNGPGYQEETTDIWVNRAFKAARSVVVSKVEVLAVPEPDTAEYFHESSQTRIVVQCLLRAEEYIDRLVVMLRNSWETSLRL